MENHSASTFMKRYNYLLGETEGAYHEATRKIGLSDSVSRILYAICDNGTSCLLKEILHNSGLGKQTANSALRRLEAQGIIYLEPAGSKNKRVCLTKKGEVFAQETAGKILRIENEIMDSWPEEDVQKYLQLTEAFLTAFREKTKDL